MNIDYRKVVLVPAVMQILFKFTFYCIMSSSVNTMHTIKCKGRHYKYYKYYFLILIFDSSKYTYHFFYCCIMGWIVSKKKLDPGPLDTKLIKT